MLSSGESWFLALRLDVARGRVGGVRVELRGEGGEEFVSMSVWVVDWVRSIME